MKRIFAMFLCAFAFVSAQAQNQRERLDFDQGWQFAFGDASSPAKDFGCGTEYFNYLTKAASIHNEGPYTQKFDASGWAVVDLPHDWVVDLPYAAEASHSHGYKTVGFKYPQTSVGWYRKTFTVPAEDFGKHIWLQFDGIFRDARIWSTAFIWERHSPPKVMYHKSADSWYIGAEKRGFGAENKSDVPRKRKILVHHFFIDQILVSQRNLFHIFACTSCISGEM